MSGRDKAIVLLAVIVAPLTGPALLHLTGMVLYGDCSAGELQKILAVCTKLDIMVFVHGPEGWVELDADTPAITMPTEQDMRTLNRNPPPPPSPETALDRIFRPTERAA